MSVELIPFAFEEHLVRAVKRNAEAWFVGRDVCHALELGNESKALSTLDPDERANGVTISDPMGREQSVVVISEPGVYRLVFRSRKPSAERFKRWLAHDVLPSLRKNGRYDTAPPEIPLPCPAPDADPRTWPVIQKLQCVQLAARIHGRLRAEPLWRQLGLPAVPPPPQSARDEARICLRQLLDAPAYAGGPIIRDLLESALDEDENARVHLLPAGIRVYPDRDGFTVANQHPHLVQVFAGTEWQRTYARVLRRLPGVTAAGTSRIDGMNRRGTFVPGALLDEDA